MGKGGVNNPKKLPTSFMDGPLREVKMICQHSQCGKKGGEGGREGETFVVV